MSRSNHISVSGKDTCSTLLEGASPDSYLGRASGFKFGIRTRWMMICMMALMCRRPLVLDVVHSPDDLNLDPSLAPVSQVSDSWAKSVFAL